MNDRERNTVDGPLDAELQRRMGEMFGHLRDAARSLVEQGYTGSEIAGAMASYGIRGGIHFDGPRLWAEALRDHAARVAALADRVEAGSPSTVAH